MSVESALGLAQSGLLDEARDKWESWARSHPVLGVVPGPEEFRAWARCQRPAVSDEPLVALAELAATDGGDDRAAAAVLAWTLLPAATRVAAGLHRMTTRSDELVAAQLWVEVRTFSWRRRRKVAANIKCDTRAGVLRELMVRSQVGREDRTWAHTVPVDPATQVWDHHGGVEDDSGERRNYLSRILDRACAEHLIAEADRDLVLLLAEVADEVGARPSQYAGLTASKVVDTVGETLGVPGGKVKRQGTRTLQVLAASVRNLDRAG